MNRTLKRAFQLALSIAAAALVAACGGGDSLPPGAATYVPPPAAPDTVAPTVAITSSVAAGVTATGDVTFTFTFSESVGSSFTSADVAVTGGTKGAFTTVSGTLATLVVTPTANTTGTINVSVGVGTFNDLAGNSNASAPTPVQVGFDTSPKTQMALPVNFDSTTVAYGFVGFGGAEDSSIVVDPTDAANKVVKVVRAAGSETYAGTTITAGSTPATQLGFAPKIPFNANDTRMSVRVWSPDTGIPVRLKVEDHADPTHSVETEAIATVAAGWQTLTFNFAPGSQATATAPINVAYNYDKATIFFDFGRAKAASVQKTYYFDDVSFVPGAVSGGGGAPAPTNAPTTTIPAGSITIYSDAASVAGLNMAPDWGQNNITRSEVTIAGNKSEKYVFGGAPFLYQGIDWTGPAGTTTIDVSAKGNLHLDLWSADIASIKISLIGGGESAVTKTLTAGSWNSIDIDLALFTGVDKTKTIQLKLEPVSAGTLYVDSVYFSGGGAVSCGTTAPTCAPTTTIPSGSITIYSDAASVAGLNMAPDWGQNNITRSEVTIASNKSEKYVFGGAPFLYQGIDWTGPAGTTTIDVSAKGSLHLDLWSADIASIKISLIGGGENPVTKTLTAGTWNSIDIDLALYTGVDKTKTIQLKLEPITAGTLYVDNIYFWGTAAPSSGSGSGAFAGGVYADDYVGTLPSLAKSTQGGDVGFFYDGRFDGTGNSYTYAGVSGTAQDPAGVHNFYFGLGLNAPAITDGYFGAYVKSPGNAPVSLASFTNLKLNVWGPDQLFKAGTFPMLKVVMQGPAAAGCATNSGGSEVQVSFATTTQGAASIYTLPLSSFTLVAGCGGDTTVAQVLAHIAQVNVLLLGTNIQYVNKDPNGVAFTNGLNIGSIKFN